jgi:basic membrane protein A
LKTNLKIAAAVLAVSAMALAGCSSSSSSDSSSAAASSAAPSEAASSAAPSEAASSEPAAVALKACEVTDVGGVDDKGFNQSAYAGLQQAEAELGAEIDLLESASDADYAPNINAFVEKGCDVIVTVGFLLGGATAEAAMANPDQQFAIIDSDANDDNGTPDDFADDKNLENVRALNFSTDEPSFIAGYLAAGMSETGKVGTFGGINIPPVTIFMDGLLTTASS